MNLFLAMFLCYLAVRGGAGESNVIGSNETVRAVVGQDAILPCHLEPPFDVTTVLVIWKRNGTDVHVQRHEYVKQHENNRTSLFKDEMHRGNISLKLVNVTKQDEGSYTCHVPTLQSKVKFGNVTLVVADNRGSPPVGYCVAGSDAAAPGDGGGELSAGQNPPEEEIELSEGSQPLQEVESAHPLQAVVADVDTQDQRGQRWRLHGSEPRRRGRGSGLRKQSNSEQGDCSAF
ncbi:V-set domain containing T-cell activation inhibitor 1 isoform X3 [Etheostoma spectabile]|uniref:V-set domain containing T-cell activation inhibitor 1 isoform X3 n=1 Tax=Etheostoma spectabile TaxID=54343 RepID=UPI0013AEAB93|nr:V-set domain containing T-cell activation inhibitor 1-like isoform X3 [Etheostoma spectabile]